MTRVRWHLTTDGGYSVCETSQQCADIKAHGLCDGHLPAMPNAFQYAGSEHQMNPMHAASVSKVMLQHVSTAEYDNVAKHNEAAQVPLHLLFA